MFALIRLNASCGNSPACPSPIMAGIYTQIVLMFCDESPAPVIFSCASSKRLNPLSPHDALKRHFTSPKPDIIFYNQGL